MIIQVISNNVIHIQTSKANESITDKDLFCLENISLHGHSVQNFTLEMSLLIPFCAALRAENLCTKFLVHFNGA